MKTFSDLKVGDVVRFRTSYPRLIGQLRSTHYAKVTAIHDECVPMIARRLTNPRELEIFNLYIERGWMLMQFGECSKPTWVEKNENSLENKMYGMGSETISIPKRIPKDAKFI